MAIRKKLLTILIAALMITGSASAKSKKKTSGFKSVPKEEKQVETTDETLNEDADNAEAESEEANESEDSENENQPEGTWQFLEWEEEMPEYVLKYQVKIEHKIDKTEDEYEEVRDLMTEGNETKVQITPLLYPGIYRFKVITYNLIGIPEIESEWLDFTIYQAHTPQVRNIEASSSLSSTIYLDEINDGVVSITGRNLFTLREDENDIEYSSYALQNSRRKNAEPIIPELLDVSDNNRKIKVKFIMDELDAGVYNFVATDACGLTNEFNKNSQLTVKFKKAVDFNVCAGYTCPVFVMGDRMKKYLNTQALPLSGTVKLTFVPIKRKFGYFGIAATATYSRLMTKTDGYELDGNYITGHGMLVYQFPFRSVIKKGKNQGKLRHWGTLEVHGGAGIAMFQNTVFHFSRGIKSDPALNSMDISAIAGFSAQVFITNRLYIEAGADFIMPFMENLQWGYIQPLACVGWQF